MDMTARLRERDLHVLINGLSIGSGGGYTVGKQLLVHLASVQPSWRFTLSLIRGYELHEEMLQEKVPPNCELLWAPSTTRSRVARWAYERGELCRWASDRDVSVVLQLNGMVIPGMQPPTLCHFQDPWPYRPEAWSGAADRLLSALKRYEHRRALRRAALCGFTSNYLKNTVCGHHAPKGERTEVFYNGLTAEWLCRTPEQVPPLAGRPMVLTTVSNVSFYKRQHLVIEALPRLLRRSALSSLTYKIVGECSETYRRGLMGKAAQLGVADKVQILGRVSDKEMTKVLTEARCFIMMSVCESFGIPGLEAMSHGVPVVAADCCALPEIYGDAAEFCPVDDVGKLADGIEKTVLNTDHAEKLRERGFQRIQRFTWRAVARCLADRLVEITDQRLGSRGVGEARGSSSEAGSGGRGR